MKFTSVITISCIFLAFASSCKKEDKCTAGLGGNVTIAATMAHHTQVIPNKSWYLDTIYLKFNTKDAPANLASYDTSFVGEAGEDHVHMGGLKCGDYYIYGVGYDTTISQRVKGGIPYTISQTSGEVDLNVPVTE